MSFFPTACQETATRTPSDANSSMKEDSLQQPKGDISSLDTLDTLQSMEVIPAYNDSLPESLVSRDTGALEKRMIAQGLVNVQKVNPSIRVLLKYSTSDNFLGKDVYDSLTRAYLQPAVAQKLSKAQQWLGVNYPGLYLLVYDATRPRSVQYQMWEIVKGTPQQRYVASPRSGSMHNYGASVDLTLASEKGIPLDMGTPFDFFGEEAQPRFEAKFLASGRLTSTQVQNRQILRSAMKQAGFYGILSEWWHFNGFSRSYIKANFTPIE
ncbi:MAG: M15 family metallopeptidase [Bacteroidota bacterium]